MTPVFANSATVTVPECLVLRGGSWRPVGLGVRFGVWVHPRHGPVLIDTGYGPEVTRGAGRSFMLRLYNSIIRPRLDRQPEDVLAELGYRAADVSTVVITHFHADHVSGLKRFARAHFVLSGDGWTKLQALTPFQRVRHGVFTELLPADFAARQITLETRPEVALPFGLGVGRDVFGDGTLLSVDLPGHALGHTGLLWPQLDLLYAADAQWLGQAVQEKRPPRGPARLVYENEGEMAATLDRLRAAADAGCRIIFCHDPAT